MEWKQIKTEIGELEDKYRAAGYEVDYRRSPQGKNPKKQFCRLWVKEKDDEFTSLIKGPTVAVHKEREVGY